MHHLQRQRYLLDIPVHRDPRLFANERAVDHTEHEALAGQEESGEEGGQRANILS